MLIDGGHVSTAETVHEYLLAELGEPLNHLVVSSYDADHVGGIQALLIADNLWYVCDAIAEVVASQDPTGPRAEQIGGFSAGACAAVLGAYGKTAPAIALAKSAATAARTAVGGSALADSAAETIGINAAESEDYTSFTPLSLGQPTRRKVARAAGSAAANAVAAASASETSVSSLSRRARRSS